MCVYCLWYIISRGCCHSFIQLQESHCEYRGPSQTLRVYIVKTIGVGSNFILGGAELAFGSSTRVVLGPVPPPPPIPGKLNLQV